MGRRPDGATARTEWVKFRITEPGLAVFTQAAAEAGESLSEWIRKAGQQRAERDAKRR